MASKMRLSGLISGMDTESIITSLVSVRRTKVTKLTNEQTKMSWKQDIWKDINKQLKSLHSTVGTMRFSTDYAKKTTKVSDPNKASVMTSGNAVNAVQSLKIEKLAKTAYLTGGAVERTDGKQANALTKLSDLGFEGNGSLKFNIGGKEQSLDITGETTINDVLSKLQNSGLNASFDASTQRMFISAKSSGVKNDFSITATGEGADALAKLGLQSKEYYQNLGGMTQEEIEAKSSTKIDGADASIVLNGARFTGSTNVFDINGLTITANAVTAPGEEITLTTQNDTSGIYDMIKNFLTSYNTVINKLDSLYNAESAKGFEPLSDEEKEAMSETEAEKYEQKIKDALLKGDDSVNSITNALSSIMAEGVTVNGKKMYLSDFGISTLSYFSAPDNEKRAYHIDGDGDDENTSGNEDKLKAMITKNPSAVTEFFTKLSQELYKKMNDMSSSVNGYRSFGSFYNDKRMTSDYNEYKTKITDMEDKVNAYEDKLYKQYAAMEKALAKMQSNTSAVSALVGGGN